MAIKNFFVRLYRNSLKSFSGYNLWWHLLAIALTYFIIHSGFDWVWFTYFRKTWFYSVSFSAALIGGILPLLLPLVIYVIARIKRNRRYLTVAAALFQAAAAGWVISSLYKSFTGRSYPPQKLVDAGIDISHIFHFGIFRNIFWGWPSSHTTVAFAMAVAMCVLFRRNKYVQTFAMLYAFYIGFCVSISIHWFSDFIAGAIIGTVIGVVVGKSYEV